MPRAGGGGPNHDAPDSKIAGMGDPAHPTIPQIRQSPPILILTDAYGVNAADVASRLADVHPLSL